MNKLLITSAVLGAVFLTHSAFSSEIDLEYLQKDRAQIALKKKNSYSQQTLKLAQEIKEEEKKRASLIKNRPSSVDEKGTLIPGKINPKNKGETITFLSRLTAFDNKIEILDNDKERVEEARQKYVNLYDFYSTADVIVMFDAFTSDIEYTTYFMRWDTEHTPVHKIPLYGICAKLTFKDAKPLADFNILKAYRISKKSERFENDEEKQTRLSHGFRYYEEALSKKLEEILKYDLKDANNQKKIETTQDEMNNFQVAVRERHKVLKKKINTLTKKRDSLLKSSRVALKSIETPNTLTLTPQENEPFSQSLINMNSTFFKIIPINSQSSQSSLELAKDEVRYATAKSLKEVKKKLKKAKKEESVLSNISSFFDDLYTDLSTTSKLT